MRDVELYRHVLGLELPWTVARVELEVTELRVDIWAEHADGVRWPCPECGAELPLYDHSEERSWRHVDTCQFQTFLHARPPRVECPAHGVKQVRLPWAEPGSRFTMLMEAMAIEWLKQASQKAVAKQLHLSWDEIHGIMKRAVKRGLNRRKRENVAHIGVDEKSHRRGFKFLTLVNDLDRGRVLYIAPDREQSSLDGFWATLNEEQLNSIQAVAIDMWDAYLNSLRKHLPDADSKIVFDKFHIAHHLGSAVDRVRRKENKALRAVGDHRLKGSRFKWLRNISTMKMEDRREFAQLRQQTLKTSRAWALKETAMHLFNYRYEGSARKHFSWWHRWAVRSRLEPIIQVAGMLKRRFENIITYLRHRITNAASESINAKIQWVKYTARGFRNMDNFIEAIYFHCGGLDLAPLPTQ